MGSPLIAATPGMVAQAAGRGGMGPRRLDRAYDPPSGPVAPSSSGIFRGRLVIIFGAAGSGAGLYVYSPTPGPANLKASIAAQAGTDLYSNNVRRGIVAGAPGGPQAVMDWIDNVLGTPAGVFAMPSGNANETEIAELSTRTLGSSVQRLLTVLAGAKILAQPDNVDIRLGSSQTDLSQDATGFLVYTSPTNVSTTMLSWDANGLNGAATILNSLNIPNNAGNHFGVDNTGQIYLIAGSVATTLRAIAQVVGDTNNRWQMDANGKMQWGPGNAAPDVDLFRGFAGALQTDSLLRVQNNTLQVQAAAATNAIIQTFISTDTVSRWQSDGNGKFSWGPGGSGAVDSTFYRSSAGILGTSQLVADISGAAETWHTLGALAVAGVTTVTGRYRLLPDGDVEIDILLSTAAAVATFSQAFPTTLPAAYRPLANKICAVGATGASWTISASRLPNVLVDTVGDVQVNMPAIPGAVANIGCTFRYPLN